MASARMTRFGGCNRVVDNVDTLRPGDPVRSLRAIADSDPQRLLIETASGERYTYQDMYALSARYAQALLVRGVAPGDRVVAQVDKSPQAVALYLACLRISAVFVPLNTAYTLAELEYFLQDSDPRVAVVRPQTASTIAATMPFAHVATLDHHGVCSLDHVGEDTARVFAPIAEASESSLATLLYTSGTTGRSKGAMLSRDNLASNAQALVHAWRFTSHDVLIHALPIFHVHGLFVAINTVLASGASMLFFPRFEPAEVVTLLSRATVMMGVPTFYTRLLTHATFSRESCRNMRLFVSGSAPLLPETHRAFLERTGHAILERYGMSETLMNTSNPYEGERVPGSVGPPLPGVEVRITEPESGTPLPTPETIGMIEVRGPNVFSGYWRMPEKTASEFRADRFFITGDLGKLDRRGYLHIVGRGKDLVITGGYNVYPIEVETEIDALTGVVESAVIGVPHPDFGEGVTAVVVAEKGATLDEQAIRRSLEARLANYKLPKRVVFVDELPRNTMGKVQKGALRERYAHLYVTD